MDVNYIVERLRLRFPLFGHILVNLNFIYDDKVVIAPAFTDGKNVYYTNSFIEDYNDYEKEFIFAHEIFHIVLFHLFRNIGRDQELLNYVADGIINQLLIQARMIPPKDLVLIEDALNYSVEELYMKYLPKINEIKKWMSENTYHIKMTELMEQLNKVFEEHYQDDLEDLMNDNEKIKNELVSEYQENLRRNAEKSYSKFGLSHKLKAEYVGKAQALLHWQQLLQSNIKTPDESTISFYEVEMDGIIHKEVKQNDLEFESEIIIDTSASMDEWKIKAILRECKNILATSSLKVGFCDHRFYGFVEVNSEDDIDNLDILGRGGTNLELMAESFSPHADNKIVITDGDGIFSKEHPEVLYIIINSYLPFWLDPNWKPDSYFSRYCLDMVPDLKSLRIVFINEKDIPKYDNKTKRLALTRNKS